MPVTDWARAAERAGFGSLWVIEDYFHPGAFALAAAAAAVTGRLAIGLGVVNPYTRHPALLAMETQALAGVAPGRVVLGLGTSNRRWIQEQMGLPFHTPLGTLRACVDVVRRLWAGERVTHEGRGLTLRDVALARQPEAPMPPIVLGVKGPRALRLAGEIADGVIGSILTSPAHVRRARQTAAAARHATDRPGDPAMLAYVLAAVGPDGRQTRERIRPLIARYLGFLHGQSILVDAGLTPAATRPFVDALAAGRPAAELVTDAMIDTLAVAGTPAQCHAALRRYADAGLDAPVLLPAGDPDPLGHLARLGAEVVPAWREIA